jgi:glc operon protein GlcG
MRNLILSTMTVCAVGLMGAVAHAQQPSPSYGPTINLENAKKVAAAAEEESKKNNWQQAIAIVSPGGNLVYFARIDGTQIGSVQLAQRKARSAALFRRTTKSFEERVASGGMGLTLLTLGDDVTASEGGVPIMMDGKVVGAIGVSGGSSVQDGQVAAAGTNAVK